MSDKLFLNLGCGGQIAPGWVNVDCAALGGRVDNGAEFHTFDITEKWVQVGSMCVDGIVLHHVLDLLDDDGYWNVLDESRRVLKLGGVLRISLADVEKGIMHAMQGDWAWFPEPRFHPSLSGGVNDCLDLDKEATLGFFITQGGARKQLLRPHALKEELGTVFPHVEIMSFGVTQGDAKMIGLDSREDESFYLEAIR